MSRDIVAGFAPADWTMAFHNALVRAGTFNRGGSIRPGASTWAGSRAGGPSRWWWSPTHASATTTTGATPS